MRVASLPHRWISLGLVAALLATVLAALAPPPPAAAMTTNLRWGYYITWDRTSYTSLQQHVGQLDIVSPYFYDLQADGTIKAGVDASALSIMRAAQVKIVPMIANIPRWNDFHNTIADATKRETIAQRITDLVVNNGYDGIHIDFEAVNASDRDLLTDFMQRLAGKLHSRNKLVTQAVVARTSDTPTTWGGVYDYSALARINDFIVVMAYDYHYSTGGPGAIAPIDWVSTVVEYAKTRIPASKILLGVPAYGYDWDLTAGTDGPPAASLRYDQAVALKQRAGASSGYDTKQEAAWVRYTAGDGHQHEAWYETVDSLHAKFNVMLDEGLGGFAMWRLGQEDPSDWPEIGRLSTPATRIPPFPNTWDRIYFSATGHSLAYGFKAFWERNGGLPVFGYPLTEEFSENGVTVQYFERQRFEWHPENPDPYKVLLGLLGVQSARAQGLLATAPFQSRPRYARDGCDYFPQTGHYLCYGFRSYWHAHGLEFGDAGSSYRESLALFGYPISEEFQQNGVTVQYFERARFEWHPENPDPYKVLLGLLGTDAVRAKGWIR